MSRKTRAIHFDNNPFKMNGHKPLSGRAAFHLHRICALMIVFVLCFSSVTDRHGQSMAASENQEERVLILYQERQAFGDQRDTVSVIEGLLGHYQVQVKSASLENYKWDRLNEFQTVMVLAMDQNFKLPILYKKLSKYPGHIIWLGSGVESLLEQGDYPLVYEGPTYDFVQVHYQPEHVMSIEGRMQYPKGPQTYSIGTKRLFHKIKSLSDKNQVLATLSDGKDDFPFMINAKNLTYISRVDLNEPLFYIFADFLNSLWEPKEIFKRPLMISIQGVHPFTNQSELKNLASLLKEEGIPFNVLLTAAVAVGNEKNLTDFTQVAQFAETLQFIENAGGHIILEAYPMQLLEDELRSLSLDEFYSNDPLPIKSYVENELTELVKRGLSPRGVSSSYQGLSARDQSYAKESFSTFIGEAYIEGGQEAVYPYVVFDTADYNQLLPLNIGIFRKDDPLALLQMQEQLGKITLVGNFFASVFIKPEADPQQIQWIKDQADAYQLNFYNLEDQPFWIKTEQFSLNAPVTEAMAQSVKSKTRTPLEVISGQSANIVLIFLIATLILFSWIFTKSKRSRRQTPWRR